MGNRSEKIFTFTGWLNNEEHDGGVWLPHIQRNFVWSEEQIERLFDSLMRKYPIGTLLIWKTRSQIKFRKFIDKYSEKKDFNWGEMERSSKIKRLVLDGQQRLQSLFIGLRGSYNGKVLCFKIDSGRDVCADEIKYVFKFIAPEEIRYPFVKLLRILNGADQPSALKKELKAEAKEFVKTQKSVDAGFKYHANISDIIDDNIALTNSVFRLNDNLSYQELDATEDCGDKYYNDESIVEIFIRANAGGTKLNKSDLLFTLLTASWDDADEKIADLLKAINTPDYRFTRDFILKTALVVFDKKALFQVKKFREASFKKMLLEKWPELSKAIRDVRDLVYDKTYLRSHKIIPSYSCLIPAIYFRYHYPQLWKKQKSEVSTFIVRTMLCGSYSFAADSGIDATVNSINVSSTRHKSFGLARILEELRNANRQICLTENKLFESGYGSRLVHLLFSLWYKDFDYTPAYEGNLPQVDHIFPRTVLEQIKAASPDTGKPVRKYTKSVINQFANCMLLKQTENGAGEKTDKTPEEWFSTKSKSYLETHLIPVNRELWKVENFEKFIEARKKLLRKKFSEYFER